MVNKNDAIGWDEWRKLPIEQQMSWKIPMTTMFNVTHLRLTHPVILMSDYLRLHNLSANTEWSNGAWLRTTYHEHANIFPPNRKPNLHVIENEWYDPSGVVRVDFLPEDMKSRGKWSPEGGDWSRGQRGSWQVNVTTMTNRLLRTSLPSGRSALTWDEARAILDFEMPVWTEDHYDTDVTSLKVGQRWDLSTTEQMERVLQANGWEVLYTYTGA